MVPSRDRALLELRATRLVGGEALRRARAAMLSANLPLVLTIARRFVGSGLALEDLVQEGAIGLLVAIDRFDFDRGARFSTFATPWIRHSIGRSIENMGRTVRVPVHVHEARRRSGEWQLAPDVELDEGHMPDAGAPSPEALVGLHELAVQAHEALATLTGRERDILRRRFGDDDESLAEVGRRWGVTKERVRQVQNEALGRMRGALGADAGPQ